MENHEIRTLIEQGLPGAVVEVDGDGTHFSATVVSSEFADINMLQRHRMVYAVLGTLVGREIHALSITALSPDEREKQKAFGVLDQ